jgi:hypothetical protein
MKDPSEKEDGDPLDHRKTQRRQKLSALESIMSFVRAHEVVLSLFTCAMAQVVGMVGLSLIFLSSPEKFVGTPMHWGATILVVFGGSAFLLSAVNALEALQKYRTSS